MAGVGVGVGVGDVSCVDLCHGVGISVGVDFGWYVCGDVG